MDHGVRQPGFKSCSHHFPAVWFGATHELSASYQKNARPAVPGSQGCCVRAKWQRSSKGLSQSPEQSKCSFNVSLTSPPQQCHGAVPDPLEIETSHHRENSFLFISIHIWHKTNHVFSENQRVIPFLANLILKSMRKLEFSWNHRKVSYSPMNQGWQDIGRVFRDLSLSFTMSMSPLGFSDHLLTSLDTALHEPGPEFSPPLHQTSGSCTPLETSLEALLRSPGNRIF